MFCVCGIKRVGKVHGSQPIKELHQSEGNKRPWGMVNFYSDKPEYLTELLF